MASQLRELPQWMSAQNKGDTVADKEKSHLKKNILEDDLPFLEFPGSIVYSYEASDCSFLSEDIRMSLSDDAVIGFDIEWSPIYSKGKVGKVALIQLCTSERKCYLFHIATMSGFPKGLKMLLEDETIRKAGVGVEGDQWKLLSDFDIKLKSFVELSDFANQKLKCKEWWSLNGLTKHLFSKQLLKEDHIRCGNWDEFPLSDDQKLYAATDAYVGLLIYQKLEGMSTIKQSPFAMSSGGEVNAGEVKKQLTSIAEELLQLANDLPDTLVYSQSLPSAVDVLTGAMEKLEALRNMYVDTLNFKEKTETNTNPWMHRSIKQDHEQGATVGPQCDLQGVENIGVRNATSLNRREKNQIGKQAEEADEGPIGNQDRLCMMSLDISESELQLLERQAKEEVPKEEACLSEDLRSVDKSLIPSCVIESDEELELEMLKSLEDIDRDEGLLIESQTISERRSHLEAEVDLPMDDDEDEGIEEADEDGWDPSLPEPNAAQITCLKTYFGHSSFKPVQWKVIRSVLQERRDNLVVMATGYGKSLCYQFAPVYTGGTGIVICPLISLMEDQVLQLKMSNIPACFLGSAQTHNVLADVRSGHYRVVYMTPEFCSSGLSLLQHLNDTVGITLIAVDEAHCISEWGHDFRSAYRTLGSLKAVLPSVPIVALTATASPSIRIDIAQSLRLKNHQVTCTSFDRPNLYLEVGRKTSNILQDLQPLMIKKQRSAWEFEGPTIIYCPSKKLSERVTAELMKLSISCGTYHAGKGIKMRRDVHHRFMRDEIQCVVATIAFGMGINKPDIRKVIHYGAPKEMESYYQEIGRAGRDGLPSSCHVFWASGDMNFNRHMLSEIKSKKFQEYKMKMLAKMEKYLNSLGCRRKIILSHFEDKQLRKATSGIMGTANCCDNCRSRLENNLTIDHLQDDVKDFGQQAYQLMSAISALGERFGIGVPVLFLRGSYSQRLPDKYRSHPLFGSGKDQSETWWKALARQLITEGFLKEASGSNKFATICAITNKGNEWICRAGNESHRSLLLQPNDELFHGNLHFSSNLRVPSPFSVQRTPNMTSSKMTPEVQKTSLREKFSYQEANKLSKSSFKIQSPKRAVAVPSKPPEPAVSPRELELQTSMYGKLVAARQKIACEKDIPPAVLATNKVLVEMAKIRPTTVENMKKIDGVSEAKSTMLAPLLLVIEEFCLLNNLKTNIFSTDCSKAEGKIIFKESPGCSRLPETDLITYCLFRDKHLCLSEVADARTLPISVVGNHLAQALKAGYPLDLNRAGLTPQVQEVITNVIQNPPINSDFTKEKAIRMLVPADIELYLIRMMIAMLQKYGCTGQVGRQSCSGSKSRPDPPEVAQSTSGPPQNTNIEIIKKGVAWIETEKSVKWSETGTHLPLPSKVEVPITLNPPPIKLASWNQPGLDIDTEELFADSQSQSSSPPSKRKLPEWFGAPEANVSSSESRKKTKMGAKRGLFG